MITHARKKLQMWYKVQELSKLGLSKSQIRLETGLARSTIKKYQEIGESEFHSMLGDTRKLPKKLAQYRSYVKDLLNRQPYLSAAQVEDRLKEQHTDLPPVHSKTVYNFTQAIRLEHDIPKPRQAPRNCEKLPELEYGKQAQVDFGETWMQTREAKRKKVYFFTMVLSRSRYKFVYLSDKPFTSKIAVDAHYLAFEYFGGITREILYDQDKVFMHNENLGDYLLTESFSGFCKSQSFKPVFCRKVDPQSKGKVENVVKYVKQNFLRGREFVNIDLLNRQALAWLARTGNAKVHSGTQLIPAQEWEQEKKGLLPLRPRYRQPKFRPYKVRKDNTILYKSNYYSLPLGTYKGPESTVLAQITEGELHLYDTDKKPICTHKLCLERGKTIRNTDHKRPKSRSLETYHRQVLDLLGKSETAENYLQALRKNKSRYYRDNLVYITRNFGDYQPDTLNGALLYCLENKVFNARDLIGVLNAKALEKTKPAVPITGIMESKPGNNKFLKKADIQAETGHINNYENFFK